MTDTEAQAFITRYFHLALEASDLDQFASLYAEDGVLEDPVGTPPLRGRAAIREFLARGRAVIASARPSILAVKCCGDECAVHWTVEVRTVRGQALTYDGIGIFLFAESGELKHVKEYYDASQLALLFGGAGAPAG
ncbi:MAG TPA: nuclear transport factor 2 family protein [Polyangiaceae bacterium]|nr:nuclear transport factor 2 family protein [Polyangiaceae bacterium]